MEVGIPLSWAAVGGQRAAYVFKLRERIEKREGFWRDLPTVEAGVVGLGGFEFGELSVELRGDGSEIGKLA